jgi:hypothetical protein
MHLLSGRGGTAGLFMEREAGYLPAVLDDTSDTRLVALAVERFQSQTVNTRMQGGLVPQRT